MSEGIRYIHTQEQAQAELERHRRLAREQYACKRQSHMAVDHDTSHPRKQNRIQVHLHYVDNITDADIMARTRQKQKEKNLEFSADERANLLEKIQLRYYSYAVSSLTG